MSSQRRLLAYVPPRAEPGVLATATRIARRHGMTLELVDVVSDKLRLMTKLISRPPPEDLVRQSLGERRETMEARVSRLRDEGHSVEGKVRVGVPAVEIVRAIAEREHRLAILGADPTGGRVYGGTTLRVLRNAPCPVWIVRPRQGTRALKLLAAIDPTGPGEPERGLDRRILELAVAVASRERPELLVVHVWNSSALPSGSTARVWRDWYSAARTELHRQIADLLKPHREETQITFRIVEGDPATSIVSMARAYEIDLVVLGAMRRIGAGRFLIGDTTERVLQKIDCSVLTVKPEDFTPPMSAEAPDAATEGEGPST